MSDEDRDVDIETDEEEDSDVTQNMTMAEKRAHHNALERKRRDHIKESFIHLRETLPALHNGGEKSGGGTQASRAQVLKSATEYIAYMTKKNTHISSDINKLKRNNEQLDKQVRALEQAKRAGSYALNHQDIEHSAIEFKHEDDEDEEEGEGDGEEEEEDDEEREEEEDSYPEDNYDSVELEHQSKRQRVR